MTHSYVQHDSFICVSHDSSIHATWLIHTCQPWLNYICDLIHPYESWLTRMMSDIWRSHGSHIWMKSPWLLHICDTSVKPWLVSAHTYILSRHDSFAYATRVWLLHTRVAYVKESWRHESWPTRVMTHVMCEPTPVMRHESWLTHISYICDLIHSYVWAMPSSYMRHDSFIYATWLIYTC